MTASEEYRPERTGPVDDRADGVPSRSDFPVRRGAATRGPVSRDDGLVGGRARFRSDRHRTWNARRDVLPGGHPVQLAGDEAADDVPPPLPADLRVDRLEVVHDRLPEPPARTGWPASPQPPTVAARPAASPAEAAAVAPTMPPAAPPTARPMPASVGRGDGSITRVDLADLLPRQTGPDDAAPPPSMSRPTGRRAAPQRPPAAPAGSAVPAPLDDLVPHPQRQPYGVDLPTSADELFPPSTRRLPPDLLSRKPAGTSTGLQPRIFSPGSGTDESPLPVLVGDPATDRDAATDRGSVPDRAGSADGVRRFDLAGGLPSPVRPDPRLPLRPTPPAELDVTRAWGAAPQPTGDVGPATGPLAAVTAPTLRREPVAPGRSAPVQARAHAPVPVQAPVPAAAAVPAAAPVLPGVQDVSDLATLFGPRPLSEAVAQPGHAPVRVGHARRPAADQPARRGWLVPTVTAALGLVAGIVFASSGEPGGQPAPASTVYRTVTVAPTP